MNENNHLISAHDVSQYVDMFLAEKTREALKTKTRAMVYQYNKSVGGGTYVRHSALVKFLGFSCSREDVPTAIQIVCSKLNDLAQQDLIVASMTTMLVIPYIKMISVPNSDGYAVMSYVAVTQEGEEYIKEYLPHLETREGGVPRLLGEYKDIKNEDTGTYAISEE